MKLEDLQEKIGKAIAMLYEMDYFLIDNDISEWSIAHRLAVYIEQLFPGWDVDCEYNRQENEPVIKKRATGKNVRPDIIIHHRGEIDPEHNLLVIELKKEDTDEDFLKVCEYTSDPAGDRSFKYQYGLILSIGEVSKVKWFSNGELIS